MKTILGVDYSGPLSTSSSKPPKAPSLAKAKQAGMEFAIVRGCYGHAFDRVLGRDWEALRAAGIVRGVYLFPVMHRTRPPESQIQALGKAIVAAGGLSIGADLPPVLDVEFPRGVASTGMTRLECLDWVHRAATVMEDLFTVTPIIYTSARVWDGEDEDSLDADAVPVPELVDCPLWLARYPYKSRIPSHHRPEERDGLRIPPVPRQLGDATDVWIHQYQGDALDFPGFVERVDLNRFFPLSQATALRGSERVRWMQRKLRVFADGIWGPLTEKALRAFQVAKKLPGTGVVDVRTFAALCWA